MSQPRDTRPVALVTGGLRGLGRGIVEHLVQRDFTVVTCDLPKEVDAGVLPDGVNYVQLDIADIDRHSDVIDAIAQQYGRLDCLVNNAGIAARPLTDILDLGSEAFDTSIDVNLRGTFFLTQAFARKMLNLPTGDDAYRSIVIISSIAAELVNTDRAQYCITKAGLSMVTKLFAQRLAAHGIYVHEVRPGFMHTEMLASVGQTVVDEWIAEGRVPIPRWGTPDDVGTLVATLASGGLPYLTGQPLWVAGGLNLPPAP